MTVSTEILKLVPMGMSMSLLSDNLDFSKKPRKVKDIASQGIKNILGLSLIKATAQNIDF